MEAVANRVLEAALAYAAMGWLVIPLHSAEGIAGDRLTCTCAEPDCQSPAKHPITKNGLTDASADPEVIERWWKRWPFANVGIVAGAKSGLVVLDVDPRHGGETALAELMGEHGEVAETVEAATGSGGMHILFSHPGRPVRNSVGKNGWLGKEGLDIRGDGGYIVAAPSLHIEGRRYAWKPQAGPGEIQLASMPQWMLEKLERPKTPERPIFTPSDNAAHWLGKALAKANIGNRNQTGLWLACQLRDGVIPQHLAEQTMRDYAARVPRGDKPYTEAEALATCRSAYGKPAREPARGSTVAVKSQVQAEPAKIVAGAADELGRYFNAIDTGKILEVPFPWSILTRLTQALLPGTITMIVGDPGVGKTFLILQCLRYWYSNDYPTAAFFIEKDRRFHTMRLLAQLEGKGCYVSHKWLSENKEERDKARERNAFMIDELGKCIHSAPLARVTLNSLLGWIRQMASAGKRIIVVDPITAVAAGNERWTKDDDFVIEAQGIVSAHGSSLILTTHPKKGNRPGAPTMHDQAGGAAYSRFTDTDIWIHKPKLPRRVEIVDEYHIRRQGTFEQFFQLHKARNGIGAGREIAFLFGDGLMYAEQGIVKRDLKDKKTNPQDEEAS